MKNFPTHTILNKKWLLIVFGVVLLIMATLLSKYKPMLDSFLQIFTAVAGAMMIAMGIFTERRSAGIKIESSFLLIAWLGLMRLFTLIAGGPVGMDETLYLHTAFNISAQAQIISRYTHIYLLRLFILIAGSDPFLGARLMWSFLIATTCVIIYLTVRKFLRTKDAFSSILCAILAVFIFILAPICLSPGILYADDTVMFLISLGVFFYLLAMQVPRYEKMFLILFGLVFFLAVNAKEIGAVLGVLIFGLGFNGDNLFSIRRLFNKIKYVALGLLIGLMLFLLLDSALLGDLWFHLRLSNWQIMLKYNVSKQAEWSSYNYYSYFASTIILPVFILGWLGYYLLEQKNKIANNLKIIWVIPLAILLFNTMTQFQQYERYSIPIYPVIIVLGVLIFQFDFKPARKQAA